MDDENLYPKPRLLIAGDSAITVEFGNEIDESTNRAVRSLAMVLANTRIHGVRETIPSYCSLLVNYDPLHITFENLQTLLSRLIESASSTSPKQGKVVVIPTIYGGDHGPDLPFVAEHNGLSEREVIKIHSNTEYLVYMIGFTPGFAYLGGLSPGLFTPRLSTPRKRVPAGAVGIGGNQTGVYPIASPGGWRIIGQTSLVLFDHNRQTPALLEPGDIVRFEAIGPGEYGVKDQLE